MPSTSSNPAPAPVRALFIRAVTLHRSGDLPRARDVYLELLREQPRHSDALHLLGVVAAQMGNHADAVSLIQRAIELDPANAAAFGNLGSAYYGLRQLPDALAAYDNAIGLQPGYADAHFNRGNVLKDAERFEEALVSYDRAAVLRPDFVQAHFLKGNLLYQLRRLGAALASYDRALALTPEIPEGHSNRGNVLCELKRYTEALASYDRALARRPDFAEAHSNRGNALRELEEFEAALTSYDRAIALDPAFAPAHFNRGVALNQLRRPAEALASYDQAIAIDPDFAEAHFNKALVQLLLGDFAGGWAEHEWRWKNRFGSNIHENRHFSEPLWRGDEPLSGKTLLLYVEQGFGDALQFCRYVPLVAALGARVILEVPLPLAELLASFDGVSQLVIRGAKLPAVDYRCPLMSLPLAFKTDMHGIPAPGKYLCSDPAKVAQWRQRLGDKRNPRVGLMWNGNAIQPNDRNRSFWLAEWIAHLPAGFQYVSLQKEPREADQKTLSAHPHIQNHASDLHDFSDTAALCECLDVVVSVCTSVAHLSAALGRPTWIMLAHAADWRWLMDRADSPWYPTARLYRQAQRGDWLSVFQDVARDLIDAFPADHAPP